MTVTAAGSSPSRQKVSRVNDDRSRHSSEAVAPRLVGEHAGVTYRRAPSVLFLVSTYPLHSFPPSSWSSHAQTAEKASNVFPPRTRWIAVSGSSQPTSSQNYFLQLYPWPARFSHPTRLLDAKRNGSILLLKLFEFVVFLDLVDVAERCCLWDRRKLRLCCR